MATVAILEHCDNGESEIHICKDKHAAKRLAREILEAEGWEGKSVVKGMAEMEANSKGKSFIAIETADVYE